MLNIGDKVILIDGTPKKYHGGYNYYNDTYCEGTEGYITSKTYHHHYHEWFYTFSIHERYNSFDPIIHECDVIKK